MIENEELAPATEEKSLKRVVSMATLMVQQAEAVKRLEATLKDAKAELLRMEREDLPELMREIGLSSVKLADGSTVEVVEDVECAISEERRPAAHAWLTEHGFGGLIKTQVITAFDRGELETAVEYAARASAAFPDHPALVKDTVHPATLKSFVKEQIAAGAALPYELFGVHPFSRAKYRS
jgi:hypothetical protein